MELPLSSFRDFSILVGQVPPSYDSAARAQPPPRNLSLCIGWQQLHCGLSVLSKAAQLDLASLECSLIELLEHVADKTRFPRGMRQPEYVAGCPLFGPQPHRSV